MLGAFDDGTSTPTADSNTAVSTDAVVIGGASSGDDGICGLNFGCFGVPAECASPAECDMFVSFRPAAGGIEFRFSAKRPPTGGFYGGQSLNYPI